MPVQLVALSEGPSLLLDKPIVLVGRDAECDIRLDSRKVSRRHCCLAQVGDQLVVRDLGSTNGIRINGVRVVEGHLKAGDELAIGNRRYQLRWDVLAPDARRAGRAAKKEVLRPPVVEPVDDVDMGSSDEIVPPDEPPNGPAKGKRGAPAAPPVDYDLDDVSEPPSMPGALPEDIDLAPPGSDPFVWARRPPPKPPKKS